MPPSLRPYRPADFRPASDFLIANFLPENRDGNWLQPAWEYMHTHPNLDELSLGRIGVWQDGGDIVGIAHYESQLGEAFFQRHPAYAFLKVEMLDYAEARLCEETCGGEKTLRVYVPDFDRGFQDLVVSRGYQRAAEDSRPLSWSPLPRPWPPLDLPSGFRMKSLADDNDLQKVDRVLWRGFDHRGAPPETGSKIEGRCSRDPTSGST